MNIAEAAATSGLSEDTIRFYEKSGMMPRLLRDARGWRAFRPADVEWLTTLRHLRATGMPLADVKAFAQSAHAKDTDAPARRSERYALLRQHAETLALRQAELDACRAYLDHKLAIYGRDLEIT